MDITIKLLMSMLVNQKLGITEANRLFSIIEQHYRYELTSLKAKVETVAMLIDCERLKLFDGKILSVYEVNEFLCKFDKNPLI